MIRNASFEGGGGGGGCLDVWLLREALLLIFLQQYQLEVSTLPSLHLTVLSSLSLRVLSHCH